MAWACVGKVLACYSDVFYFAKQHPDVVLRDPIASHQQLHREIVKQLVERRLDATLIEHHFLPLQFDPVGEPAQLRPCSSSRCNAASKRPSGKKSEFV
jgi:hypothetical protein